MAKYRVYAIATASTYVGEFDAKNEAEAENKAAKKAYMSLCHECGHKVELGDIYEFQVEKVEESEAAD